MPDYTTDADQARIAELEGRLFDLRGQLRVADRLAGTLSAKLTLARERTERHLNQVLTNHGGDEARLRDILEALR